MAASTINGPQRVLLRRTAITNERISRFITLLPMLSRSQIIITLVFVDCLFPLIRLYDLHDADSGHIDRLVFSLTQTRALANFLISVASTPVLLLVL